MDHAYGGGIGGLIIAHAFGLGGNVVLKIRPNGLLIIELIYDFAGLFDGLYDELYLIIQIIDLLYLYFDQVVFQDLLASLGIAFDALL